MGDKVKKQFTLSPCHPLTLSHHFPRPEHASRVIPAKIVESPLADRPADVSHQPLVEPNIMHRAKDRAKHLAGIKKVPDRYAAEIAARIAVASRLNRLAILQILTVPQPLGAFCGERIRVAAI